MLQSPVEISRSVQPRCIGDLLLDASRASHARCLLHPQGSSFVNPSSDSASRSLVAQVVRTHLGPTEIDLHHGVPFLHPDSTLSKTTVGRCTVSGSFGAQPPSMHPTNTFPPSNSNWPPYFSLRPRYPPHHWLFHENFACDS